MEYQIMENRTPDSIYTHIVVNENHECVCATYSRELAEDIVAALHLRDDIEDSECLY